MKRYKVVQDRRGHYGIQDTGKCALSEVFASWGDHTYSGADLLDQIVMWAGKLNQGDAEKCEFTWGLYEPRKEKT